jgi:predicted DNA-binding transcriptional regulator AlpA
MGEILDVEGLAAFLKMSKGQIYSMTERRTRAKQEHPLPFMRVNGNLRFSKSAVEAWLRQLQEAA